MRASYADLWMYVPFLKDGAARKCRSNLYFPDSIICTAAVAGVFVKRNIFEGKGTKENIIFRDEKYLYPDHLPERLPHRDAEVNSLVFALQPVLKGGKPHNVFIAGSTGTGKTATVKYVLKELQEYSDRAKGLYINCFEFSSRHSVLSKISNFLGSAVPRRGIATDEIHGRFVEALRKAAFIPIIVLDEVDQLILNEDGEKLLYDVLRAVEMEKVRIGLVMISNDVELTAKLDARVKSSLSEDKIIFSPYSPQQLKDIMKERCSFAFAPESLSEDVIPLAAAYAAKLGGDARVGIESLLKAGREAEKENAEKVEVKHLKKAFEVAEAASLMKGVKHLSEHEKILLSIIASKPGVQSGDLFTEFSGKGIQLSERRVRDILNSLEKKNFINAESVDLGNMGKTRQFTSRLPKELLLKNLYAGH